MRTIWLIAINYLREQRWAVILLLIWVVISAGLATLGHLAADDALFFIKQQAIYGVVFSAFLAASAVHNERRSRRILAVLAKGVERGQYLAGLIAGVLLGATLYCGFLALFAALMFRNLGLPAIELAYLIVTLLIGCALAATTAMIFGTFAPPLVAIALTAVAFGVGVAMAAIGVTRDLLPVYALMNTITSFEVHSRTTRDWPMLAWGAAQSVLWWLVATWIFVRRDVAVAVE